jgi:hypothetical protein
MSRARERMSEWVLHCEVDTSDVSSPRKRQRQRMPVLNYFKVMPLIVLSAQMRLLPPSE